MRRSAPRRKGGGTGISVLTPSGGAAIHPARVGDALQGAAADCNSAGATRAWFDSRVAHHFLPYQ